MFSRLRELIIQLHRYIGIPMSVIIAVWFVSGIVMMYTRGMPALSPERALELKSAIPLGEVRLSPGAALRRAGFGAGAQELHIESLLLRPIYRFDGGLSIFADDGELFAGIDEHSGRDVVATAFALPIARVRFTERLSTPDQWTITESRHLPLLKYVLDDEPATTAYVSEMTGEVVLATDRASRLLAWIGAIPHWIYFTSLRINQPAWYWTIIVLSAIGCLVAVLGLVLTFTQFQRSTPFNLGKSIPYRGLMRWHYLSGAIFGLFALTWLFSGLLSMDPFGWNDGLETIVDEFGLNSGPPDIGSIEIADIAAIPAAASLKRIEIRSAFGQLRFVASHSGDVSRRIFDKTGPVDLPGPDIPDDIMARLALAGGAVVSEAEWLHDYDDYYYDREHRRPLPVIRAVFDDPHETWAYIDPATGRIEKRIHRLARLNRWMFNGLHSLDFAFWYDKRPLWDAAVILLSLGGLATSSIGLILGLRRIRRWIVRLRGGL